MTRLRLLRDGAIGRIILARPEEKNALDRQTADDPGDHPPLLRLPRETRLYSCSVSAAAARKGTGAWIWARCSAISAA